MNKEEHAKVLAALEALYLEMEVTPSNVHVMQDAEQCIAIMRKEPEPISDAEILDLWEYELDEASDVLAFARKLLEKAK